MKKNRY